MESLDTGACLMDDLLDFSIGEEDDDEQHNKPRKALPFHNPNGFDPATFNVVVPDDPSSALPVSFCLDDDDSFRFPLLAGF